MSETRTDLSKFNSQHFSSFEKFNCASGSTASLAGQCERFGRSGNGLRCLEPCQKFRKFNSDHFPFFKNLYRTSGSRVSLPWLEIGSGRSGNGLRCLEPGQNFRKFNSEHFPFLKNVNPTSGSRISSRSHKKTHTESTKNLNVPQPKTCAPLESSLAHVLPSTSLGSRNSQ